MGGELGRPHRKATCSEEQPRRDALNSGVIERPPYEATLLTKRSFTKASFATQAFFAGPRLLFW
jgi:hypothetical protein